MEVIKNGDQVLIWIDEKRKFIVKVEKDKILGTDKGFIRLGDLIGLPYGSAVKTSRGDKVFLYKPLIHDYIHGLERATQIIYPKDLGFMIYLSGIGPGSRVGEAGVGTGALTLSIAFMIGENGVLYGFDISEKALSTTSKNLEKAGLLHRVRLIKHDIREKFNIEPLDAFFLDIPDPWNALVSVGNVLKESSPIIIYVPTINQVEKTVLALMNSGLFHDIHSYEIMLREYEVKENAVKPKTKMIGHTGYIIFARKIYK
ncbi:MAG: tRNA (adenine-N1)-methyltransferase [Desulfurococcaceae archaeon]